MKTTQREPAAPPAPPAAPTGPSVSTGVAAAIYFGLAVLYFLPAFLPDRHIYGSDYLVGGYAFHDFISRRFSDGALPKWVPHVYGGLPLWANPGSTYHPVRFLADLVFPVSRIWPTFFVVHFGLAGLGMFLLAREMGARRWVALVGGLAFQFTGLMMSWVLGGHEGRIIVAALTPLTFYFFHLGIRTGRVAPFAGAAAALGSALLTFQIQSSYYLLVGALIWSLFCLWHFGAYRDGRRLGLAVGLGLAAVAFAFAMASVNFLPFLDYVDQSPRGGPGRGYEYSTSFSMPAAEVLDVAVPELHGTLDTYRGTNPFKLHTEYVGATVLALFALGFGYTRRNRYWWFFLGLGLFALTLSLGGNTPLYRLYYEVLPGTKKFRAPSISFFLVSLSLVAMATLTLERLAQWREARAAPRPARAPQEKDDSTLAAAILGGVVVVALLLCAMAGESPTRFRLILFLLPVAGVLWAWMRDRMAAWPAFLLLGALTVVDLWIVDRPFFQTVDSPEVMFAPDDVMTFLETRQGRDRIWILPFPPGQVYRGQPGNYPMMFDVDQAGGEHGNQLQRFNQFLGAGRETYVDWHNFLEAPAFLNAGNIRYIVSGVELPGPQFREVHRGSALVYENLSAQPRAYLAQNVVGATTPDGALEMMRQPTFDARTTAVVNADVSLRLPGGPLTGQAQLADYSPDRVVVRTQASREALLVLADNYYEGWTASVDGRETPIVRTNHTFRGVVVPAGSHEVTFTFRPTELYTGFYLYLACMAILAAVGVLALVRHFRGARPVPAAR